MMMVLTVQSGHQRIKIHQKVSLLKPAEMVTCLTSNLTFRERKIESFQQIHTHHLLIETLISTIATLDPPQEKMDNIKNLRQQQNHSKVEYNCLTNL